MQDGEKENAMIDKDMLSRRTFLKGAVAAAALVPMGALLSACAGGEPEQVDQPEPEQAPEPEGQPAAGAETANEEGGDAGRVLVAYFSATGNTEGVADIIAGHLDAGLFAIAPAQPYTDADLDYNDPGSRTSQERANADRIIELEQVTPDGFDAYDTVFVGFPIWWYVEPRIVDTFLERSDFSGKTVIPFATSGGSGIEKAERSLRAHCPQANWRKGKLLNHMDAAAWTKSVLNSGC